MTAVSAAQSNPIFDVGQSIRAAFIQIEGSPCKVLSVTQEAGPVVITVMGDWNCKLGS